MKRIAIAVTTCMLMSGCLRAFAQGQPGAAPTPSVVQPASGANVGAVDAYNAMSNFDLNVAAPPPPLMGTITQEVAFTIERRDIHRGNFTGVVVKLKNGTNSPVMFDGDRAKITVGGTTLGAVTDAKLEAEAAPNPSVATEAKITVANALTIGAYSTVTDQKVGSGPILPRYGTDQMRREATLERFGLRILWPGDETQGILYFPTEKNLAGGKVELPVVTFPEREIRGYLTGSR